MRIRLALALSIAALPLALPQLARPALAQTQTAAKHFQAGMAAFKIKDYQGAIAEWKIAESIKSTPGLYYDMAVAYKRLNDSPDALAYYQKFLAAAPPDDPDRADAQANAQALQQAVPTQPQPPQQQGGGYGSGYQNGGYPNNGYPMGGSGNGQPTYNAPPPGPNAGGAWSPGPLVAPPASQAVAEGRLEAANVALGLDFGFAFNLGALGTQYFQSVGWGLKLHLDASIAHSVWLYGLVDFEQFDSRPGVADPTSGGQPKVTDWDLGGGAVWTRHIVKAIYFAPSAGVGYGQLLYDPNGSGSGTANYNHFVLFLDASFYLVGGNSEFRVTPISLDVFVGNSYDPKSAAPAAPAGFIRNGGATSCASVGYTYLF